MKAIDGPENQINSNNNNNINFTHDTLPSPFEQINNNINKISAQSGSNRKQSTDSENIKKKENILDMPDLIQKHQTKKKKENLKLKTIFKIIKEKKRIKIQLILWIFLSPPKKKLAIILLLIIL